MGISQTPQQNKGKALNILPQKQERDRNFAIIPIRDDLEVREDLSD